MNWEDVRDWWRGYTFGGRSGSWPRVRKAFLKENPLCAVCGRKSTLLNPNECHHVVPFSVDVSLELLPSNLCTLCRPCHYLVGHLTSWSSFNSSVREDARVWRRKVDNRP